MARIAVILAILAVMTAGASASESFVFRWKAGPMDVSGPVVEDPDVPGEGDDTDDEDGGDGDGGEGGDDGDGSFRLRLKAADLPDAMEGDAWAFDFSDLLEAPDGAEPSYSLRKAGNAPLPPGFTFVDGPILAATPRMPGDYSFYVVAEHDGKEAVQRYEVTVGNLPSSVAMLAVGGHYNCAVTVDGAGWCWGSNIPTPTKRNGLLEDIRFISNGNQHRCAIKTDGSVWCWGNNGYGQLGDGSTEDSSLPVQVQGLGQRAIQVSAGDNHTCAVLEDNTVKCWGWNGYGSLGNGTTNTRANPVPVTAEPLLTADLPAFRFKEVHAGSNHTCGLTLATETVFCWGYNFNGQLGDGTTTRATRGVKVTALMHLAKAVAVGTRHSCAVTEDGRLFCWGRGSNGELGTGDAELKNPSPMEVTGIPGEVIAVAAQHDRTCAINAAGYAYCWGDNLLGGVGGGFRSDAPVTTPVRVLTGEDRIVSIGTGVNHACALAAGGKVWCWGSNVAGQLGIGPAGSSDFPVVTTRAWE